MSLAERLRALRGVKHLSQGEVEKRSGLLRSYISRIENGHSAPTVETLEKLARALEVPLYQLFHDSEQPPEILVFPHRNGSNGAASKSTPEDQRLLGRLGELLGHIENGDRKLLLLIAAKMARSRRVQAKA
ncbi:MAG TPA: helix-turn-helix transcriptional regulator [Candidatus Acidoferrales bacterium]|nr:helix-turn-helix transcriptional regulator [Candidatus Acidoferrales bacterium]